LAFSLFAAALIFISLKINDLPMTVPWFYSQAGCLNSTLTQPVGGGKQIF
jgi:hypothetical protein